MSCDCCGAATELWDSEGGIEEGHFVEEYTCVSCSAWGKIEGDASDPPHTWNKKGPLFNGN